MSYRNLAFTPAFLMSAAFALGQGINPGRPATDAPETVSNTNRYLIEFRSWGAHAPAAVRAAGGTVLHEFPELHAVAAQLPPQAAQALQRNPAVNFVEVDPQRYMMATDTVVSGQQTKPYGISMVQAPAHQCDPQQPQGLHHRFGLLLWPSRPADHLCNGRQ